MWRTSSSLPMPVFRERWQQNSAASFLSPLEKGVALSCGASWVRIQKLNQSVMLSTGFPRYLSEMYLKTNFFVRWKEILSWSAAALEGNSQLLEAVILQCSLSASLLFNRQFGTAKGKLRLCRSRQVSVLCIDPLFCV